MRRGALDRGRRGSRPPPSPRRLEGGLRRYERGRCERNRVRPSPTQGRRKIMKMVGTRIAASLAGLAVAFGGAAAQQSPRHHIVPLKDIPSQQWIGPVLTEAVQGDMGIP